MKDPEFMKRMSVKMSGQRLDAFVEIVSGILCGVLFAERR